MAIVCKQTDCPFSYVFRERIEGEYNLIFQNNVHTCDFVWPEEDLILMRVKGIITLESETIERLQASVEVTHEKLFYGNN